VRGTSSQCRTPPVVRDCRYPLPPPPSFHVFVDTVGNIRLLSDADGDGRNTSAANFIASRWENSPTFQIAAVTSVTVVHRTFPCAPPQNRLNGGA